MNRRGEFITSEFKKLGLHTAAQSYQFTTELEVRASYASKVYLAANMIQDYSGCKFLCNNVRPTHVWHGSNDYKRVVAE